MTGTGRTRCTFARDEQAIQLDYFRRHFADRTGHRGRAFQLQTPHRHDGLMGNEERLVPLFEVRAIQWHPFIGHGRSSQACCINFLAPLGQRPDLLSHWIGSILAIDPPPMLPVERGADEEEWFVAFEYTGPGRIDYLGEANGGVPQRGANATAADAAVAFERSDGRRELLLVEWKYTEEYRHHRLSEDRRETRASRYGDKAFAPAGPIRADLELTLQDFFYEPFYQLLRQQMLAHRIETHPDSGFDRVRVLHLSPSQNHALHVVTAPALREICGREHRDAFAAYRSCIVDDAAFIDLSIERAFAPLADHPAAHWMPALRDRYPSLFLKDPA